MKGIQLRIAVSILITLGAMHWMAPLSSAQQTGQSPSAPVGYTVQMVTVQPGVHLQDWGGSGRPVILLAGLGYDAHEFDSFAPKLTSRYHVYAVSRRCFGASSAPPANYENYSADRLADDVLNVMQALKIENPIWVGYSIAGEELSSKRAVLSSGQIKPRFCAR